MKRPSKFDGKGRSLAGDVMPFPSPARRVGQTANSFFPGSAASARDQEGAGVSPASASSTFTPLGDLTHAVVLRLAGGYPRIRVERAAEEALAARSGDQPAAWEDEERR